MDEAEFKALKATMPWCHTVVREGRGARIVMLNNAGAEVDLIQMVRFNEMITAKLAKPTQEKANA